MYKLNNILIVASLFLVAAQAHANECLSRMPNGIKPSGQAKICHSAFTGLNTQYSCQDYRQGPELYRVVYKGGLEPKAIVKLTGNGQEQLVWSTSWGDPRMRCPLPAPPAIPRHAQHRGLGICLDENDASIACSVYEHAQARESRVWRYLVFYHPNGKTEMVHRMAAGDNRDAMVAEIAYQFGLSLLETDCCSEQATAYLEYAHRLFPRVSEYRSGYLEALLEQLAANDEK